MEGTRSVAGLPSDAEGAGGCARAAGCMEGSCSTLQVSADEEREGSCMHVAGSIEGESHVASGACGVALL
eukprot:350033-Pelagomonas_calceolata.AAC.1